MEKIGDRILKVQFVEYVGKRKGKVTHIEVKQSELDRMIKDSEKPVHAQFSLFYFFFLHFQRLATALLFSK